MNIALVSEFFYPTLGGIQEHLYNAAKAYLKKGHDVKIITPRVFTKKKFEDWWPHDLPQSVYLPVGYSLPFFMNDSRSRICVGLGMKKKLENLLTPKNFDIVHLHAPLNGTLPIMAGIFCSTHLVGTFHTSFEASKNLSAVLRRCQSQIDLFEAIMGVSPITIEAYSKQFKFESQVIPNGIDTDAFKPLWETNKPRLKQFDDGKINILFIGRPDPRNGLDTLISAFSKVYQTHKNIRLIVVGGGEGIETYKSMARALPQGAVEFMGAIRENREDIYRSAHIHVFHVGKAAFSVTLLEGMASGLAVVTCPFEGYQNAGTEGEHFLTVPFGDVTALAKQLEDLILNPEQREYLGRQARKHALTYDWSIIADRIIEVYNRVLEKNKR